MWDGERVLAEFSGTGVRTTRYAYLPGDFAPTQQQDANGTYYVHSDHLDTPRLATNGSGVAVWKARYQAFGSAVVDQDPDGNSVPVTLNVRFPGQYADAESGTYYNYFRDYDPSIGRYVESDPIGLKGGINTYAYANNDPVSQIDPEGLWGRVRTEDWALQDYSICSYYDQVARTHGCKYHAAAARICRGGHLGVNLLTDQCGLQNTTKLNCIRRCLVRKDTEARQNPQCQKGGPCTESGCTRLSCINRYHNECFRECGSGPACYGGNYDLGTGASYQNDGD